MDEHGPENLKGKWGVGDPIVVEVQALPKAFISYDNVMISDASSSDLRFNNNIVISVVVDMKREFSAPTKRVESHEQVIEMIAGRDDNMNIREDSIVGCLRKYQDLENGKLWIEIGTETEIDYGLGIEKRGPGIMTAEGLIRFQVTLDQIKPEYYA